MKVLFLCYCFIVVMAVDGFAQTPEPTPVVQPTPTQQEQQRRAQEQQRQQQREFERMRAIDEQSASLRVSPAGGMAYGNLSDLYRHTTNKELKILAPEMEDLIKYKNFLRQPETGIIKLAADKHCFENPNVIVATNDCLAYTMPGAGNSYSFRVKDYRIPRLADITFTDNSFQATGIRLHGLFADLGDIPLEQVNLQTKGLEFAENFAAEPDLQKAKEIDLQLVKGIKNNGYFYRRAIAAKDNTTYVLRSIAYRGKLLRAAQGVSYNELDFDKRKDVLIVFRIVRRGEDGSVTILWKQLAEKNSPKTKLDKKTSTDQSSKPNFAAKNK